MRFDVSVKMLNRARKFKLQNLLDGSDLFRVNGTGSTGGWWLALPFALLAAPTAFRLSQEQWGRDFGAYGPLVLAAGGWLLWREAGRLTSIASPGASWITWPLLAASCCFYVFGRAFDFITLETLGAYGCGLAILQSRLGLRALATAWFPLAYLALVIPIPGSVLSDLTAPLKEFVSWISTASLAALGLPVVREGVVIYVAQYQLLVEDACSGMNSIVGLIAVGLLYIYLMRAASPRYSLALTILVAPIAILTNIIRIMALVTLTYYAGDEAAQGFLHLTAGLALFGVALLLVFALDAALWRIFRLKSRA